MLCPYCRTEQPHPPSRFCVGCGLAIPGVQPASWRAQPAPDQEVRRCSECGAVARSRRCRACGAPVRWPDDVIPPDEAEEGGVGQGPAPDLELPMVPTGDEPDGEGESR